MGRQRRGGCHAELVGSPVENNDSLPVVLVPGHVNETVYLVWMTVDRGRPFFCRPVASRSGQPGMASHPLQLGPGNPVKVCRVDINGDKYRRNLWCGSKPSGFQRHAHSSANARAALITASTCPFAKAIRGLFPPSEILGAVKKSHLLEPGRSPSALQTLSRTRRS